MGKPTSATDDGSFDGLTPRGFTGHEMLDDLGLVHMNGRIYDPLLGRMLSADIAVQFPGSLQSYNRYSYVENNPLTKVDPSGFFSAYPGFDRDAKAAASSAQTFTNNKIVQGVGITAAGFVPYVGDAMDAKDVVSPGSTGFERSVAGASLTVNAFTGGLAPNAGPIMRGLRQIGSGVADLLRGGSDTAKAASNTAEAGAHMAGNAPTPHVDANAPKPEPVEVSTQAPTTSGAGGNDVGSPGSDNGGGFLYRTGSQTDNALTDSSGVSFRDTVTSSADPGVATQQVFKPGDKIWAVDTSALPGGSVVRDGSPAGHVSVVASPDQIRAAIVSHSPSNPLFDFKLKLLDDGKSYRLPK